MGFFLFKIINIKSWTYYDYTLFCTNKIKDRVDISIISECTGLSKEKIEELKWALKWAT